MRREGVADFGNDLSGSDLRYSKGFIKFGCPDPSKIIFDFWNLLLVEEAFGLYHKSPP